MKRENILSVIFLCIFLMILILPHFLDPLLSDFLVYGTSAENRNKTSFPKKIKYRKLAKITEEYYNDRMPFRNIFIKWSQNIHDVCFPFFLGQVIEGKNGFLFYNPPTRENSLSQYKGKLAFRTYNLKKAAAYFQKIHESLKEINLDLYIVIPPNKLQVYPDKLPVRRKFSPGLQPQNQLKEYLQSHHPEINFYLLCDELLKARTKCPFPLYYPEDTHWNNLGAYVGTRFLIRTIAPECQWPEIDQLKIIDLSSNEPQDLWPMMGKKAPPPKKEKGLDFKNIPRYFKYEERNVATYFVTKNPQASDRRKVLIFRDSFAFNMQPYLSAYFAEVHYIWEEFSLAKTKEINPDLVIIECVARVVPHFK